MIKIMIMVGTRPEVIKVALLVKIFQTNPEFQVLLCDTGQHRELVQQSLADFGLIPDFSLELMQQNQTLSSLSSRLFAALEPLFVQEKPDWLIVQGDTTTVMVSSLCAFYHNVLVGHVEAGLRTYQRRSPFPEEINRQIVSRVANVHFTPTQISSNNLIQEGIDEKSIVLTGNTVIDALLYMSEKVKDEKYILDSDVVELLESGHRMILVTGHRRENFGDSFIDICRAILDLVEMHKDIFILYPVHLNPNVQKPVSELLGTHPRILLKPPFGYKKFIAHLNESYLILTDSGGIQEEAPALNKPVLVMRDVTERAEGVESGVALLVGTELKTIVDKTTDLLLDTKLYQRMANAHNPYGDGRASEQIVDFILNYNV